MSVLSWLGRGQPSIAPLIIGGAPPSSEPRCAALLPLGMMPLLPGEEKEVWFSDQASRALIAHAVAEHHSCCAQLLVRGGGELVGITGLLEIHRLAVEDDSTRLLLRCVGRVGIREVHQTEGTEFLVAKVEPFADDVEHASSEQADMEAALGLSEGGGGKTSEAASAVAKAAEASGLSEAELLAQMQALLSNLEGELRSTLASLSALRAQLWQQGADEPGAAALIAELEALGEDRGASLDELVATRTDVLTAAALADGGAPCDCLSELWGVDVDAGKRQVLSFAAAATLGGAVRANALVSTSASQRLYMALAAAREQQRRLGAVLALKGLVG